MKSRFLSPELLLILLAAAASLAFSMWYALLNNFVIERAAFTGREIGLLQSLREVPGFLAFTTIFVLLVLREQSFALISVALLGLGVALTGFLPTEYGLYFTTVLMSIGFHYYFTLQQSLTLQWIAKERSPIVMGRQSSAGSVAALVAFGAIWLGIELLNIDYQWLYLLAGTLTVAVAVLGWLIFPAFSHGAQQHKKLFLRKRYWLYYLLVFMSGARRQIFIVFATFLMVEKFGLSASDIALLYLVNHSINTVLAPRVGHLIARWGERPALILEYVGLIGVFVAYALVDTMWLAATLFVVDHLLFALAIGIKSYFHKIADPADIAATSGVSFTINHIAAVVIPALFGIIWLTSPSAVFLVGAAMAGISLLLALMVPEHPEPGREVNISRFGTAATSRNIA